MPLADVSLRALSSVVVCLFVAATSCSPHATSQRPVPIGATTSPDEAPSASTSAAPAPPLGDAASRAGARVASRPTLEANRVHSAFGRFVLAGDDTDEDEDSCTLSFVNAKDERQVLVRDKACLGPTPGMNQLVPLRALGKLRLPRTLSDGTELHIFHIAAARGGNATDADQAFVVFVSGTGVAVHTVIIARPLDGTHRAAIRDGTKLTIITAPTTTEEGSRVTLTATTKQEETLPRLPSHVVRQRVVQGEGDFDGRFHYTNWNPRFTLGEETYVVDDLGSCADPETLPDPEVPLLLTLRLDTYDDGRIEITCLSLAPR